MDNHHFCPSVLLIDHSDKVAEKIRISGGGRCNFTNRDLDVRAPHKHFVGQNPQFCRSALSRYTSADFIALVQKHGIPFHEKHKGQLFADRSAEDIIQMLLAECEAGQVTRWQPCSVKNIAFLPSSADVSSAGSYQIDTSQGAVLTRSVVVATGGLSIPKIGATDLGYRLAQQTHTLHELWRDDLVVFAIGCSFSFEQMLMDAGIRLRHIEQRRNVAMFRTNIRNQGAGPFGGNMVVSMRPMKAADAIRAVQITSRYPAVHGAPVHLGDPALIGIADIYRPDYGDPVEIMPDELPVFWACGVTPQEAIRQAQLPLVITHQPGYMLVTDIRNAALAAF
eukprot:gene23604-29840_t